MTNAPFQSIPEASRSTGLSQSFLRRGCKAGTVPHITSGNKYMIDVPTLLLQLRTQTTTAATGQKG